MKKLVFVLAVLVLLGSSVNAQVSILYDNGPIITNIGAGYEGADASAFASSLSTYGSSMAKDNTYHLTDDFVIPVGESWNIDHIRFYGYQTGSTTTSTFTGLYVQIWNGQPGEGGASVVWGNLNDNILTGSAWSGIYRTSDANLLAKDRPIMWLDGAVSNTITGGSYWLEWTATGSLTSGPWNPPVVIDGQLATGNARQFDNVSWYDVSYSSYAQGMPFIISGNVTPVPEPSSLIALAAGIVGLVGYKRRRA